jgi:hypothetical protein
MADRNGYIGRAPGDSSVVVSRQIFSPTGVTTTFTFASSYTPGYLDLYLNGVRLVEGTDYTATDTSSINVLNGGAQGGDVLEGVAYKAFNLTQANRVGIQSAGVLIGNAETLNFIGVGNTFLVNGTTVDVSIQGGGGSGVASTITVADESSDTTCFPIFATAATGDINPKTGSNLTFNSNTGDLTVLGQVAGASGSFTGNVSVGGTLTYDDVTNIDSVGLITARTGIKVLANGINAVGVVTATSFSGSGAGLTSIPSGQLTGALPAISGAALTGLPAGGVTVRSAGGSALGSGITDINFQSGATVTASGAGSTITIAAGITTSAGIGTNTVFTLNLSTAQDHKVTTTGISTITVSGGAEGDSHTVRIINSGISTVGFSTHFLFPSGSPPSLPTADGAISLISFTVNRVGGAGTQLLAGASVNFS